MRMLILQTASIAVPRVGTHAALRLRTADATLGVSTFQHTHHHHHHHHR